MLLFSPFPPFYYSCCSAHLNLKLLLLISVKRLRACNHPCSFPPPNNYVLIKLSLLYPRETPSLRPSVRPMTMIDGYGLDPDGQARDGRKWRTQNCACEKSRERKEHLHLWLDSGQGFSLVRYPSHESVKAAGLIVDAAEVRKVGFLSSLLSWLICCLQTLRVHN